MDKRIQRTRKTLGNALVELLQEQPFHQLTIRQITERAAVAYSTFFRNFESIDDLLLSHLGDLLQDLKEQSSQVEGDTLCTYSRENIRVVFEHVQQNESKYETLLTTPAVQSILRDFQRELAADNLRLLNQYHLDTQSNIPPVNLVIHTSICKLFSMIEWWLENDLNPEIDTMVRYYEQLVINPTRKLLFGEDANQQILDGIF